MLHYLVAWILVLIAVYRLFIRPFVYFWNTNIPSVPGVPLFGNLWQFRKLKGLIKFDSMLMERYGTVVGHFFGRRPVVLVADPAIIESITVKQFKAFRNRAVVALPRWPLSRSLLFLNDEHWKRVRTIVSPTFSSAKLREMSPIFEDCVDLIVEKLQDKANLEESLDVYLLMKQLAFDVVLRSAFGLQVDQKTKELSILSQDLSNIDRILPFVYIMELIGFPQWLRNFLFAHVLSPSFAVFSNILASVIAERRSQESRASQRIDLLHLMMAEDGQGLAKLNDIDMMAQSTTFLIAGLDTTSSTLGFCLYCLALHPDVQETLYDEIQSSKILEMEQNLHDSVRELEYLDQVVCETLRLYPPAFTMRRHVNTSQKVGKYYFPKGTDIRIPIYVIHHSEKFWESPEEFRPGRFSPEERQKIEPFTFLPFGQGPRHCIGMRFALTVVKIALLRLVTKYTFETCSDTEVPLSMSQAFLLIPNRIHLKVRNRCMKTDC